MRFYADLHIHSKYSRATSSDCDLEHLAFWGRRKGISVLGTGDFTHPAWFEELRTKLVPAEPGLYRLRPDLQAEIDRRLGAAAGEPLRFVLQVEISTIYKKGDRTRKVHHVIFAPDLDTAGRLRSSLERVGNIRADGRPILGLDSRALLEITLQSGPGAYLIPAHIWTPWFSVLGAQSGFESIEDCYADLSPHIFAVETGLSSDPPMNWRLSSLDRYHLVSNSDAHSPSKLGRECCVFDTDLSYPAMRRALETGTGYGGTVEFFPEEGKYHMDGHRKCGVCLTPEETKAHRGQCPVCGKAVTVGVMSRVAELADRAEGTGPPAPDPYRSLIPLVEVLGEILGTGPQSRSVQKGYDALLSRLGSELEILELIPVENIGRAAAPLLAEAITRMRSRRVIRQAGFDGEYGVIRLFEEKELRQEQSAGVLFQLSGSDQCGKPRRRAKAVRGSGPASEISDMKFGISDLRAAVDASNPLAGLDPEQRAAAEVVRGPLLIIAGPGTGKTRTLIHRIAYLVAAQGVKPEECLAVTFTRRAANEMRERLQVLLPDAASRVPVMTFHALGLTILRKYSALAGLPPDFRVADEHDCLQVLTNGVSLKEPEARRLLKSISKGRRTRDGGHDDQIHAYRQAMRDRGLVDFDDLVTRSADLLQEHADALALFRSRFPVISVDEYQDIDDAQYRLLRLLAPSNANLCAIGDPDQAIYGFRGSDVRFFQQFTRDYPGATVISLTRNYRSARAILEASLQAVAPSTLVADRTLEALLDGTERITFHESPTDRAEAEFVVHAIERMIGGATFFSMDSGRADAGEARDFSFSDFAVLYRTDAQAEVLCEALARSGMPFERRSHGRLSDRKPVNDIIEAVRAGPADESLSARLEAALSTAVPENQPESAGVRDALRSLAHQCGDDFALFLSEAALAADADLWDPRADRVGLLTLHAAKGLEFRVVFIVGCEDGVLPLNWGGPGESNEAEERRLFFVGMTRARERLFLSHARRRMWRGRVREMGPSRFLKDIHERLVERSVARGHKRQRPAAEQLELL